MAIIQGDRRANRRYELMLGLSYEVIENGRVLADGCGQTTNVSSGGVLFTSDESIYPGVTVELHIQWPFAKKDQPPMELFVSGQVVRSNRELTAIRTASWEFRRVPEANGNQELAVSTIGPLSAGPAASRWVS